MANAAKAFCFKFSNRWLKPIAMAWVKNNAWQENTCPPPLRFWRGGLGGEAKKKATFR